MDFEQYKKELMKDPAFAEAYEELGSEMDDIRASLNAEAGSDPVRRDIPALAPLKK